MRSEGSADTGMRSTASAKDGDKEVDDEVEIDTEKQI